ncbi:four helix bundle protein [Pleurocapsa sp. PCC 7319]|uniref:four helix bundle protein n=1 Tax=Pleurocapsa sp. PCC 7319 TaxID=118161 RepID=UPI00034C95F4|nr:four helix bundle protein [Pleurocapsa sp. PCC 7319]
MEKSNIDIYDFAKKFAVKIVKLCNWIEQTPGARRTLSNQLIRSGTSVGANLYEAKYAESNADFIHKLRVSRKECSETIFWLEILIDSGIIEKKQLQPLLEDAERIGKILTSIIKSKLSN